jgi:hypothetical protein
LEGGFENLNAARMSAAGEGSTEPNLNFYPLGKNANESVLSPQPPPPCNPPPFCYTERKSQHQEEFPMKKAFLLIPLILSILVFFACSGTEAIPETTLPLSTAEPTTASTTISTEEPTTVPTEVPTKEPTTAPPEETTAPATDPLHSQFYIPGLSVEDVIRYFGEVVLDAEFIHSGDSSVLQKWEIPIYYCVQGSPTEADLEVLENFTQWLNTLPNFPGIFEVDTSLEANLDFHFCTQEEMTSLMGDWTFGLDGAVTFWYDDNRIYDATICVRNDLNQTLRNSVILEELYNGLGPIQDTSLRTDSIIYAGYSEPQELTPIDKLILQLLYHPDLPCGIHAEACAEIIRLLYY